MLQRLIGCLFILCLLVSAQEAGAGWESLGLSGGGAQYNPAISPHDPKLMFVGCDMSNVFRSEDAGRTWTMLDMKMISRGDKSQACFHPTDPNIVFYGSNEGLQISRDRGKTWTPLAGVPAWGYVYRMYVSRDDTSLSVVATDRGVWRSADAGVTWQATTGVTGIGKAFFGAMGRLFIATEKGVYRSDDQGQTWQIKANGIPAAALQGFCGAVKENRMTLYGSWSSGSKIYKSLDLGETWQPIPGNLNLDYLYLQVVCAENDPDVVYLNNDTNPDIYKTTDGGVTWSNCFIYARGLVSNIEKGWLQYLSTSGGVGRLHHGITACATNSAIVAGSYDAATFRTDDAGASWQQLYCLAKDTPAMDSAWYSNGMTVTSSWHYDIDPNDSTRHYISYTDIAFARSEDGGESWHYSARTLPWKNTVYQIAFDPHNPGTVFTASAMKHDIPWSGMSALTPTGGGVAKSTDYGKTWVSASQGLPDTFPVTAIVTDGASLYAAVMGDGVYRSDDWGASWVSKSTGLGVPENRFVYALTLDKEGNLYCTITGKMDTNSEYHYPGGLYKSTDRGETWTLLKMLYKAGTVTIDPVDSSSIYLTAWDGKLAAPVWRNNEGGVWKSTDGGATWTQWNISWKKLPVWGLLRVSSVTVYPGNRDILYAAWSSNIQQNPWKGGIMVSYDRGNTWQDFDDMPFINPTQILWQGSTMIVTTFGSGVWKKSYAPPLEITDIILSGGITGSTYSQALTATGGVSPYTWSISSGALPAGLGLNSATGVISGVPITAGSANFTVQVRDAANTAAVSETLTITITSNLAVTTATLANGTVGAAYSQTVAATGGISPYQWSMADDALPEGLSLDGSTGVISGVPTNSGTWSFTLLVKDAGNNSATRNMSITIAAGSNLAISTGTLTGGAVGASYAQTLTAAGGKAPYTWSVSSGTLPPGVILNSGSGVISGIPTTAGTKNFIIQVKDSSNSTATKNLSITITSNLTVTTTTLASGTVGTTYRQTLTATGGYRTYTWSLDGGSLPAGLTLRATGLIYGIPTTAGTSSFSVKVLDAGSNAVTRTLSITISSKD